MSEPLNATIPVPSEDQFFKALMAHIMEGTMIPKVQIERAIGPIIGFFLAEALSEKLGKEIVTLCPEFPIRKARLGAAEAGNNQSTNIDWLMFNRDDNELILLELKTTDTTFKPEQARIYRSLQAAIVARNSAEFLIDELLEISEASQETGKYQRVLQLLEKELPDLRTRFAKFNSAKVIYLAPHATRPSDWDDTYPDWSWLSFRDLPENIEHNYKAHWPAVRNSLLTIDELTKRIRNGNDLSTEAGKNYSHRYTFEKVLGRCRVDGKSVVVGFMKWRRNLPSMDMTQLKAKTYKCDSVSDGVGKKIAANWISGDEFLSQIGKLEAKGRTEGLN